MMAYTASAAAARALVARSTLRPVASQIGAAKMDLASTQGKLVCLGFVGRARALRRLWLSPSISLLSHQTYASSQFYHLLNTSLHSSILKSPANTVVKISLHSYLFQLSAPRRRRSPLIRACLRLSALSQSAPSKRRRGEPALTCISVDCVIARDENVGCGIDAA